MPCEDLLSLTPPQEKILFEANKFLDDSVRSLLSSGKRRRVSETDAEKESPATAALEASLSFDDESETDTLFEAIKIPFLPSECNYPTNTEQMKTLPCANQHTPLSLASVHNINEMTRALAYLSTTSKVA